MEFKNSTEDGDFLDKFSTGDNSVWKSVLSGSRLAQIIPGVIFAASMIAVCIKAHYRRKSRREAQQNAQQNAVAAPPEGYNAAHAPPVSVSTLSHASYPRQSGLSAGFATPLAGFSDPTGQCQTAPSAGLGSYGSENNVGGAYTYSNSAFRYWTSWWKPKHFFSNCSSLTLQLLFYLALSIWSPTTISFIVPALSSSFSIVVRFQVLCLFPESVYSRRFFYDLHVFVCVCVFYIFQYFRIFTLSASSSLGVPPWRRNAWKELFQTFPEIALHFILWTIQTNSSPWLSRVVRVTTKPVALLLTPSTRLNIAPTSSSKAAEVVGQSRFLSHRKASCCCCCCYPHCHHSRCCYCCCCCFLTVTIPVSVKRHRLVSAPPIVEQILCAVMAVKSAPSQSIMVRIAMVSDENYSETPQ